MEVEKATDPMEEEREFEEEGEDSEKGSFDSLPCNSAVLKSNDGETNDNVLQNNTSEDDNTDVQDEKTQEEENGQQHEVRNGEFQFQIQSFHIVNARQGKKQYKCDVCTGTYQHAFSLKRHFLRTHINYRYLSEADITNCNINLNLVRQLRTETDQSTGNGANHASEARSLGLYRCHLCSTLFDTRDELKSHVSSHADDNVQKGFSCGHCEMTFSHRQNLVRHQSVHSGERQFLCRHCGKSFPSLANQRRHEKIHENLNLPFPCSFCRASFLQNVHLQKHLKKFHAEKLYLCESCPRFFLSREQLEQHNRMHQVDTEEGPPSKKCKVPDSRVVYKGKRGKSFESDFKYCCSVCKRRFATYLNMCRHKKAAHAPAQQERHTRSLQLRKDPVAVRSRTSKPVVKEMSEEEFYTTIAHRISENLLYHLDGKSSQLKIKQDQCAFPEERSQTVNVQWSIHNFPAAFDITQMMQIYSNRVPSGSNTVSIDESDNSEETECVFTCQVQQSGLGVQHKANGVIQSKQKPKDSIIGHSVPVTFVCSVCTEKFHSLQAIEDHEVNNHPNVLCTHVELEGDKEVPPELCRTFMSPVGFLHKSCSGSSDEHMPSMQDESLKCTKCNSDFASRQELHQHILDCGNNSDFQKQLTKRFSVHSRLGCSVRKPVSTSKSPYVKGRRRVRLGGSPSEDTKRQRREHPHPCRPSEHVQEGALDLKTRVPSPPSESTADIIVLSESTVVVGNEKESDMVVLDGETVVENIEEDCIMLSNTDSNCEKLDAADEVVEKASDDVVVVEKAGEKEVPVLYSPDYVQHSSPAELVGNIIDDHHEEVVASGDNEDSQVLAATCITAGRTKGAAAKQEVSKDARPDNELHDLEADSVAPLVLGQGRRILRSKTAAASGSSNASSVSLVNSHTCSTCKRSFTYLASLKKHLRDICPNKKVAEQRAMKRRRGGRGQKKDNHSVPPSEQRDMSPQEDNDREITSEVQVVTSLPSVSPVICCEEADTSGLELLANASSMDSAAIQARVLGSMGEAVWDTGLSNRASRERRLSNVRGAKNAAGVVTVTGIATAKVKEEVGGRASEALDIEPKQEQKPPAQELSCPYCLHSFAYLSNFRKHLREVCLLKKKKHAAKKAAEEADASAKVVGNAGGEESSRLLMERVEPSTPMTMSFKGRIENSVINIMRNQSKQVELIGPKAASVKGDQPGAANHSSPNFMTFSCPVCHKIFLSYVKMLQHRLSHKLQTEEGPAAVKVERAEGTPEPGASSQEQVETTLPEQSTEPHADVLASSEEPTLPVAASSSLGLKTEEDQRFDEILVGLRGGDDNSASKLDVASDEIKREEHNYAVSLAELDSLPDEEEEVEDAVTSSRDDSQADGTVDAVAKKEAARKVIAEEVLNAVVVNRRLPSKEKVRRRVRRVSGRPKSGVLRDRQ